MDTNIKFELIKIDGKLLGFKLMASGNTEAESFCASFPLAVNTNRAEIVVDGPSVRFKITKPTTYEEMGLHCSSPGEFTATVSPEDARSFDALINLKEEFQGKRILVKHLHAWGRGFELRAA